MISEQIKCTAKLNEISNFVATFLKAHNIAIKIYHCNKLHIIVKFEKLDVLAKVAELTLLRTFE